MRIAHALNAVGTDGAAGQAQTLLRRWGDYGIDAWGVHTVDMGSPEDATFEMDGYNLLYPSDFQAGLRELDPDVVFVHAYAPNLHAKLKELAEDDDFDAKFIWRKGSNVHEHWCLSLDHGEPAKITAQLTDIDWYDCLVAPSQYAAERLGMLGGDDAPLLAYVPNAIDREAFVPTSYLADDELRVITASRGGPNEALLSPLTAVMRLLQTDDVPVRLDMYGSMFGPMRAAIEALAEDHDEIEVHGFIPHDEVRTAFEEADVVAVPSISQQAVPLVALEGMAAGNIVLTSFPEAVEEEALIRLPATHPPRWHQALTDAYTDPDDAREWVTKGIEAAAKYDADRVVPEYVRIFERVVG